VPHFTICEIYKIIKMNNLEDTRKRLLNSIIDADRELASKIVIDWAQKYSYKQAFYNLFEPVLYQVGELWYHNNLSLAQGYLAGKVAEDIFIEASKDFEFNKTIIHKGNVVIGNIEDDYHSLGRKMLGIFLKSAGWTVHDLGNDIQAHEFIDKAIETNSRIIGVSAMMYTTAKNILSVRNELNNRGLSGKIQLAVGGDGTSDNA